MGVDPYLVIMWTSHRLIWDPGATFVSLTCRWRLCHIRMGGVESDKRKSCDRDSLVIGSLGAGRSLTPRARRPWSRRTGEINCPVRGIPNVHVREKPEESGFTPHNSILWPAKDYMRLEGPGVVVSWGMLTREELGLL